MQGEGQGENKLSNSKRMSSMLCWGRSRVTSVVVLPLIHDRHFILYSVNYIVDKLNDSHYGCLWPGKEDRREGKDSFGLVMYFKHTFTCLSNNKGTACKHPNEASHSPSTGPQWTL